MQISVMRVRYKRALRATAQAMQTWLMLTLEEFGRTLFRLASADRGRHYEIRPAMPSGPWTMPRPFVPSFGDEAATPGLEKTERSESAGEGGHGRLRRREDRDAMSEPPNESSARSPEGTN